ncbi:MAG TPA: hypothetical protein VGH42_05965 [Verrucomicrobiae bacterium]
MEVAFRHEDRKISTEAAAVITLPPGVPKAGKGVFKEKRETSGKTGG